VVAGEGTLILDAVRALTAHGALLAIVSNDREIVTAAVAVAEARALPVFGLTTDPSSPAVWERITQHIEQRLGPIDLAVAVGATAVYDAMRSALAPDLTRRHRGEVVDLAATTEPATVLVARMLAVLSG
jgi:NAD(P)-dependent dehydrogenase (short-subunit alcohol dehydrogenase family)